MLQLDITQSNAGAVVRGSGFPIDGSLEGSKCVRLHCRGNLPAHSALDGESRMHVSRKPFNDPIFSSWREDLAIQLKTRKRTSGRL